MEHVVAKPSLNCPVAEDSAEYPFALDLPRQDAKPPLIERATSDTLWKNVVIVLVDAELVDVEKS
eukprot:5439683-Amphidinium_carterae.2